MKSIVAGPLSFWGMVFSDGRVSLLTQLFTKVISAPLVENLGLMDRLDRSSQGIAAGVGRAKILGRLQGVPMRLGTKSGVEFALDFAVLGIREEHGAITLASKAFAFIRMSDKGGWV